MAPQGLQGRLPVRDTTMHSMTRDVNPASDYPLVNVDMAPPPHYDAILVNPATARLASRRSAASRRTFEPFPLMVSMHARSPHCDRISRALRRLVVILLAAALILLASAEWFQIHAAEGPAPYEQALLPFLRQYCIDCHSTAEHKGDFTFERYRNLDGLRLDRPVWTKVLKRLKSEVMPPPEADQPPAEARAQAVNWLDQALFYVDCNQPPDPGRVTVRRLNKTEYNHT